MQYQLDSRIAGFSRIDYMTDQLPQNDLVNAINIAEELMHRLQINGYSRVSEVYYCEMVNNIDQYVDRPRQKCFVISYLRNVKGLTVNFINKVPGLASEQQLFRSLWTPENITIRTDGTQILSFSWTNPVNIENAGACDLLPFSAVYDIFKSFMLSVDENQGQVEEIYINEIRLGYMFIAERNSDVFLLKPVWDFIGDRTIRRNDDLKLDKVPAYSQLTVDAETGAIISRNLGY